MQINKKRTKNKIKKKPISSGLGFVTSHIGSFKNRETDGDIYNRSKWIIFDNGEISKVTF